MLPLRISVQGFMSYRDHTVFDFEGARLWMLAGDNGVGKSTVFDALRWVLFGVHRGGKQRPEQLIHHEADRLRVEVELQLNNDIYKLKRTLGREGARPTWDVSRRMGEAWESLAGTSMAREYERWVEHNVGLTDEAFCASVYLSQGRADAILNADAEARYELLSQLVDLEVYELWHARADERRARARLEMTDAKRHWETAPAPEPEQLTELREREAQLTSDVSALRAHTRELDAARADASRWEEWSAKSSLLENQAAQQHALLADETLIERNFARLNHLKTHRPAIETLWQTLSRRDELSHKLEILTPRSEHAQRSLEDAQKRAEQAQIMLDAAQSAWTNASAQWSGLVTEVAALSPQRALIERRALLLARRAEQERKSAGFELDLDTQLENAQRERDHAREAGRALPLWRRFDAARRSLAASQRQSNDLTVRQCEALARQSVLQLQLLAERGVLEETGAMLRQAEEELVKVKERERALSVRRADFAQIEGEAKCHFCGQELSSEHRAAELQRLENAAREIEEEKANSQHALEAAQLQHKSARGDEAETARALEALNCELASIELELRHQSDNANREQANAFSAWNELRESGASFGSQKEEGAALLEPPLSETAHPTADDFERMVALSQRTPSLEQSVSNLQERARERDAVASELERLDEELAPLLQKWSDAQVEVWWARAAQLEAELELAKSQFDQSQKALEDARKMREKAATDERASRAEWDSLTRQIGPLQGQLVAANVALDAAISAFQAAMGLEDSSLPTLDEVSALRGDWQCETEQLEESGVGERHAALVKAREKLAAIERDHLFYAREIEALPPLSRQPRATIEAAWNEAKAELSQKEAEREQAGDDVRRLEREAKERASLEALFQERSLEHDRWEELARLLGPHQLQRHLLREAEVAIVREANAVLESISGGTLRLELVPDSEEHSGNRRPKVLDVTCLHLSGGEVTQAVSPSFLSGSQRFRVAVALALGIGRTAARGSGNGRAARVETILIDEGFGALDKTGRDEMKDELRELGRELGRVILVSHQEDFAGAFPNRFNIALENGVSRVQKVVE